MQKHALQDCGGDMILEIREFEKRAGGETRKLPSRHEQRKICILARCRTEGSQGQGGGQ